MYILLSGRVSVHYRGDQSAVINEEMHELMNVKSNSFIPVKQNVSDIINQELGPQVGQLGIYIYAILCLFHCFSILKCLFLKENHVTVNN